MDPWSLIWRLRRHHQAAAAQSRRSPSACLASTTRGEATEATTKRPIVVVTVVAQAFVVGLLGVDNKRWGNRGNRATSQGGSSKVPLSLSRWQGGSSGSAGPVVVDLLCVAVKDKRGRWQQVTGQQARKTCVHSGKEIGVMVLATDTQGHPKW